jgi:hypothetical protein
MPNSTISSDEASKLKERWLKGDEGLTLAERVFVLEKMVRRLLVNESINKRRNQGG